MEQKRCCTENTAHRAPPPRQGQDAVAGLLGCAVTGIITAQLQLGTFDGGPRSPSWQWPRVCRATFRQIAFELDGSVKPIACAARILNFRNPAALGIFYPTKCSLSWELGWSSDSVRWWRFACPANLLAALQL